MFLNAKNRLNSVRQLTEVARTRFSDKEFGGLFCRSVSKGIEETDLLLDSFVQFLSVNTPLKKRGTVHKLLEELLKKHQFQLDENKIRSSKKFEMDLPETIVPDGPLSFILDSVLQYGISTVAPEANLEFSTKSFKLEKGMSVRKGGLREDKPTIQVELVFRKSQKQGEGFSETSIFREDSLAIMLLRLANEVVRKNQGTMKLEKDEKQARLSISLWFPSERREICFYQPIDLSVN